MLVSHRLLSALQPQLLEGRYFFGLSVGAAKISSIPGSPNALVCATLNKEIEYHKGRQQSSEGRG